jgi:hypothetical protein
MAIRPLFYRSPSVSSRAGLSTLVLGLGLALVGLASLLAPESVQCLGEWMGKSITPLFGHPAHQFVQPSARG